MVKKISKRCKDSIFTSDFARKLYDYLPEAVFIIDAEGQAIDREFKMVELKRKIKELEEQLKKR